MPNFSEFTTEASPAANDIIVGYDGTLGAVAGAERKMTLGNLPVSTPTQTALDLKLSKAATANQVLDVNAAGVTAFVEPTSFVEIFEDFTAAPLSSSPLADSSVQGNFFMSATGGGYNIGLATNQSFITATNQGWAKLVASTTSNSDAYLVYGTTYGGSGTDQPHRLDTGRALDIRALVRYDRISSASDNYTTNIGNYHWTGGRGAFFSYNYGVNGGKWQLNMATGGGGLTTADSGVTFAINTNYSLRILYTGSGSYQYYINGSLVGSISTNVPANTTPLNLLACQIKKSGSSSNATTMYVDKCYIKYTANF